ncbi:MAG: hypothetical protein MI924_31370 [Chloroflexales bacterium]|nr:hypothetical protein [Chloroflexales bacterium]
MDRDDCIMTGYCLVCEHAHVIRAACPVRRAGALPSEPTNQGGHAPSALGRAPGGLAVTPPRKGLAARYHPQRLKADQRRRTWGATVGAQWSERFAAEKTTALLTTFPLSAFARCCLSFVYGGAGAVRRVVHRRSGPMPNYTPPRPD